MRQRIGNHQLAAWARRLRRQGWSVNYGGNTHLIWTAPDGTTVRTSGTPNPRRGLRDVRAKLNRVLVQNDQPRIP